MQQCHPTSWNAAKVHAQHTAIHQQNKSFSDTQFLQSNQAGAQGTQQFTSTSKYFFIQHCNSPANHTLAFQLPQNAAITQ
jgi:hypothetical protein